MRRIATLAFRLVTLSGLQLFAYSRFCFFTDQAAAHSKCPNRQPFSPRWHPFQVRRHFIKILLSTVPDIANAGAFRITG